MDDRGRLLELIKTYALKRGHFVLSSGRESTYYLDGRLVTLSAEGAYLTGRLIWEAIRDLQVDAVGGPTLGADPMATAVAIASYMDGRPIPAFIVRKEAKGHGTGRLAEGPLPEHARVAVVDDTITSGASVLKAIDALEAQGCRITVVVALVDRLEGAGEAITERGYTYLPLFTIRDLGIESSRVGVISHDCHL
jgi:orotate phosphoribosyltransferase